MKRMIWLFSLLLLFASARFLALPYVAQAKTTQELEAEIRALDAKIDRYSQRIAANKEKKDRQQALLHDLQEKAEAVEKKTNALQTQILTAEREIEDHNNQIRQLKNEMLVIKDELALTNTQIKAASENIEKTKSALQGQPIANVGESGNAKGAHLHFEVRYNGVKQNPMQFVTIP